MRPLQQTIMYVYDPKALHHIIVKDQQIFEETPGFLMYEDHQPSFARLEIDQTPSSGMDVTFGKSLFSTTDTLPWKNLHELRDIVDAMQETAVEIVESKQKAIKAGDEAILQQIGKGNDIISILIKENMKASEEDRLPDEELVGQVSSLTFAAMDTTSNALCRTLYVLCERPDAQDRLRQEIRAARRKVGGGDLGYDELVSLPYLDAVCRETLRLYPPVSTIVREAREDIILPFSKPIRGKDGSEMHEVLVPKGTTIFPSILSSNRNQDVWGSDADEWKPERWMDELPESVANAHIPGIYSHLMTFIGGSRACIGFKFSQLEMKIVLCVLLDKFKFNLPNNRKIFWRMTGIASPSIEGGSKAEMPLIVSLAD
ncbi:hypothetical protein MD484_g7882, partial [Candolleomyces efflorescens]